LKTASGPAEFGPATDRKAKKKQKDRPARIISMPNMALKRGNRQEEEEKPPVRVHDVRMLSLRISVRYMKRKKKKGPRKRRKTKRGR